MKIGVGSEVEVIRRGDTSWSRGVVKKTRAGGRSPRMRVPTAVCVLVSHLIFRRFHPNGICGQITAREATQSSWSTTTTATRSGWLCTRKNAACPNHRGSQAAPGRRRRRRNRRDGERRRGRRRRTGCSRCIASSPAGRRRRRTCLGRSSSSNGADGATPDCANTAGAARTYASPAALTTPGHHRLQLAHATPPTTAARHC